MIVNKNTQQITAVDRLPLILALNINAEPLGWLSYKEYANHVINDKISWSLGEHTVVLRGGTNATTGKQSVLKIDSIVALKNNVSVFSFKKNKVTWSKSAVYSRDLQICCYCGVKCSRGNISVDHIVPKSKGGQDSFMNTVTSCVSCNNRKGSMLLTDPLCDLELLYAPYVPHPYEALILANRNILADQMDFLKKKLPKNSRLLLQ